ncbi:MULTISPECIES: Hpt domain-containing protein [Oceanospirillaceae]|jgi:HPt (histidine-containing phosphotransfer) domain-containing protein|uniref:Hpt domain-containing protein n=1 Tax=Oceanobacter antarcticus TaxID=3133425 RepID=A0ABW8NIA3_9GAMM|tara:strand:+ start:1336 stop:1695 length:360 start_codon:yes stop_codon:yes gene_type:complete
MKLQDHFDSESLDILRDVMDDEFDDLITLFVNDSESRLPKMNAAWVQQDVAGLGNLSHSFKGASGNVCAAALSHCNKELEDFLRDKEADDVDWTEARQLLAAINQEFAAVKECIQRHFH